MVRLWNALALGKRQQSVTLTVLSAPTLICCVDVLVPGSEPSTVPALLEAPIQLLTVVFVIELVPLKLHPLPFGLV